MNKYDWPLTNQTRLFQMYKDESVEFLIGVVPWRIMWNGGKERVILKEYLAHHNTWLNHFPEGCTLDLMGGHCESLDNRHQGIWLYRFADCRINRKWIPDTGTLIVDDMCQLYIFAEIDCIILEMMTYYENRNSTL